MSLQNRLIQNQGKLIQLHEKFVNQSERNEELVALVDEKNAELDRLKIENERLKGLACGHNLITFEPSVNQQSPDKQAANGPAIKNILRATEDFPSPINDNRNKKVDIVSGVIPFELKV